MRGRPRYDPLMPDTSRRALLGAVLLDFAVSPLFIWGSLTDALSRELAVPESGLSVVFSAGLATFTAGVLVGGRAADSVAPRWLAVLASVGLTAGLTTAALASTVWALTLGFGVALGAATGVGYATAVKVAGTVGSRRGGAVAAVVSAYAAGAVVLAPVAASLLDRIGRAGTFGLLAGGLGAVLLLAAWLLPGDAPASRGRPTGTGVLPRGQRGPVVALWLTFFLGSLPALVAFGHAGRLVVDARWTVLAVVLLNVGNFLGRIVCGPAADRVGLARTMHAAAAALAAACLALALTDRAWVALAALLVLGTQYGALSVLTPLATSTAVPAERFGATYGAVFTGWGLAGLTGPLAAAQLAGDGSYREVAAALVGVAGLAWLATVWVLRTSRAGGLRLPGRVHHGRE
jgi:MFS family permease